MTASRLRGSRAIFALLVAALALAATAGATTTRSAVDSHTFLWVAPAVPTSIDFSVYQGLASADQDQVFGGGLLRWAPPKPGQTTLNSPFQVVPFLAESMKRLPTGSFQFTLRKAVSEFGNTLTAADVKWSYERAAAIDPISRSLFTVANVDLVSPVRVIDSRTVEVHTTDASALTPATLALYETSILDSTEAKKHATEADPWAKSWFATHSASFGPYRVTGFIPGNTLAISSNPNYFGPKPQFTKVIIKAVPEAASRFQLMQKGQASHTSYLDYELVAQAEKAPNLFVSAKSLSPGVDVLQLNTRAKPFDDARVRRAVALAIDRVALIKAIYKGYGSPGGLPFSSSIPTPVKLTPLKTDTAEAKRLLAEAGYPNGFEFSAATSITQPGNYAVDLGSLIQAQLAGVGIKLSVNIVNPAEIEPNLRAGKYQALLSLVRPGVVDPTYALFAYLYSKGPFTYRNGYSNPKMDALIFAAMHTDPGKRHDRAASAALALAQQELPYVPLVDVIAQHVFDKRIKGWNSFPNGEIYIDQLRFG